MPQIKKAITSTRGWYYGWVIIAVSFLILTVVFGVRLSFTVFFVALIDEFGWPRADTALIFSVSMIVFAATSTLAGIGLDKWGARRTFGVGAAVLTLGLLLSSQIQNIYQLALAYGGVAGLGITILGLGPQAALIARWFIRRRGLAIGIAFAGTGIGSLLIIPGIEQVVSAYGWRISYIVLAGLIFATLPFIVFLLRLNPAEKGLQPDGVLKSVTHEDSTHPVEAWKMSDAVRNPAFWLLMLAALGAIGPVRMLSVHQLAILVDAGFESSYAALAIGFSGVITAIAFILLGALSDKIDRRLVYLLGSLSLITAIFILDGLQLPGGLLWVFIYATLLGFGEGSRSSLVTAVASDLFPGDALGAINGTVGAAFGLGAAILPWLAGLNYDLQGSYTTGFIVAVGVVIISTLSLWLAPIFKSRNLNSH
jgi:sugar phosphate permease